MAVFSFRDKQLATNTELRSSLRRIPGVGFTRANWVAVRLGFGYPIFATALNRYHRTILFGFLNFLLRSETKILRDREIRIHLLQELGHWRGKRHTLFLPTRGQRTRTNAKTQKRLRLSKKL